jgi:hypothetical protein
MNQEKIRQAAAATDVTDLMDAPRQPEVQGKDHGGRIRKNPGEESHQEAQGRMTRLREAKMTIRLLLILAAICFTTTAFAQ